MGTRRAIMTRPKTRPRNGEPKTVPKKRRSPGLSAKTQVASTKRATALAEMEERAQEAGATAIVGVDLDYEVINNMLMVSASGTAVRLG